MAPLEDGASGLEDDETGARVVNGRLQVDAVVVPPVANLSELFRALLKTSGGSPNMIVDGSVTPVVFYVGADATKDITVVELRLVISCDAFVWNGTTFGKGAGALTNGFLIEVVAGGITTILGSPTVNERILQLPIRSDVLLGQSGNTDVLALSVDFGTGVVLEAGSADQVRITIRDNITTAVRAITYFQAAASGTKEP